MLIQKGASVNEKVVHEGLKYDELPSTESKPPEPHVWVWKQVKPSEVKEKQELSVFQVRQLFLCNPSGSVCLTDKQLSVICEIKAKLTWIRMFLFILLL